MSVSKAATVTIASMFLALAIGLHFASAQGRGGAGNAQADPTKITVTPKVYDMKRLQSEPVPPDDVYRGRSLWVQRCAYCHDGLGQPSYKTMGPWLGADTIRTVGETAMRTIIANGTQHMPGFRYALKPQQVDDLFAFLKTQGPDQKPTAAQLGGTAPMGGNTGE